MYGKASGESDECSTGICFNRGIVDFSSYKTKSTSSGEYLTVEQLRVNRLCVIRIRKVCESMRFDSGPEVFVCVNRNYVLTEYVLNGNDCSNCDQPD